MPFEVNCYRYCRADVVTDQHKLGEQLRREALSRLVVCREYNMYPTSSEGKLAELDVPAWALKELDEPFDVDMGEGDDET